MLSMLHIENIAVIERSEISFDPGFNVLTGETGAGKSIVIDAISAILGQRAYRDMIRTGAQKASVRGVFTDVPEFSWFQENGVDYDAETVIQREIFLDGKNVCRVNGCPVSVSMLHKLGVLLMDIHGQHDSASLFDEANHLKFLDDFAENENLRQDYYEKFTQLMHLRSEAQRMSMDESEKLRRMEMLRYQIAEIEKAQLQPEEDVKLEERRKVLQNAEKIADGIHAACDCVYGGEESDGAAALLSQAVREIAKLARYTDTFQNVQERLTDLMYQVQDVAEEINDIRSDLSYSDRELDSVEERLDTISKLRKKYGATCEDILQYLEDAKKELDDIEFADERLEQIKAQQRKAEIITTEAALVLRKNRTATSEVLSQRIFSELSQLDMPKVQFSCMFTEQELTATGADAVAFYMSANAGEALKPMSKVASGGELARIMLAMKNVLAERDNVATLIFDEVDTGVSGRAAQKVAEKLRRVAQNKQVLCVTHLPQLAAMADTHMLISKFEENGRTYTTVTPLDKEGRKKELARIIGGSVITETTLRSAEEMILASS